VTTKRGRPDGGGPSCDLLRSSYPHLTVSLMKNYAEDALTEPMLEHRIRLRAYELYVQGGRRSGHALEDWIKAERVVLHELQAQGFIHTSNGSKESRGP
jgi:hypothetical protein